MALLALQVRSVRITAVLTVVSLVALGTSSCQHEVQVKPPKEPITINLNINLDADVRVRLEEKAAQDIENNPGIF